jgi:hypothetical protein
MATDVQTKAAAILTDLKVAEPQKHAFYIFLASLERKSRRARWVYPIAYLALGLAFVLCLFAFADAKAADLWKVIGAVAAVFAALLAFWKPGVTLKQDDAVRLLPGNRRLTSADLQEFNTFLALPSKRNEDIFKLAGAMASFFAAYFLLT